MNIDNAVIHYYPLSPFIEKVGLNLRCGNTIVLQTALKDEESAHRFLRERFADIPVRTITHC